MEYAPWVAFLLVFAWHIVNSFLDRKERDRLMNRIMSKNYTEFEYYDKKFPEDVKEVVELREEARKERSELMPHDVESSAPEEVTKFIEGLDEDWSSDDVDKDVIKKLINDERMKPPREF